MELTGADADEVDQKTDWRSRLVQAVLAREFEDETLVLMLEAGLQEAHSEGVLDAASICERVAEADSPARTVALVLAKALRKYNDRNVSNRQP